MQDLPSAEEHLRIIRSLMERATIYRAISAPAALVGGLLGCLAAALSPRDACIGVFLGVWATVLAIATAVNLYFLARDAERRGAPFLSAGMRMAFLAMAPPLAAGVVGTFLLFEPRLVTLLWIVVYGLALLSTAHFAPRSLVYLGLLFLATGLALGCLATRSVPGMSANLLMALTFGGYHLAYAACTWPGRVRVPESPVSS